MSPFTEFVPLVLWLVSLAALVFFVGIGRDLLVRAGFATIGSAFVAYGLREVLRAWGGGYYCCNHAVYATIGLAMAGLGWVWACWRPSGDRSSRPLGTPEASVFSPAGPNPYPTWPSPIRST